MATTEGRLKAMEEAMVNMTSRKMKRLRMEVPKPGQFKDYRSFFSAFKRYAYGSSDDVQERKNALYLALETGQQNVRINSAAKSVDDIKVSYEVLAEQLQQMFCPMSESATSKYEFIERSQASIESVQAYLADKRSRWEYAYPEDAAGRDPEHFLKELVKGVYHPRLRKLLAETYWMLTLDNYNDVIQKYTVGQKFCNEIKSSEDPSSLGLYTASGKPPTSLGNHSEPMEIDQLRTGVCYSCQKEGHFKSECPDRKRGGGPNKPIYTPGARTSQGNRKAGRREGNCNRCQAKGHYAKECYIDQKKLEAAITRNKAKRQNPGAARKPTTRPIRTIEAGPPDPQGSGSMDELEQLSQLRLSEVGCMNMTPAQTPAQVAAAPTGHCRRPWVPVTRRLPATRVSQEPWVPVTRRPPVARVFQASREEKSKGVGAGFQQGLWTK